MKRVDVGSSELGQGAACLPAYLHLQQPLSSPRPITRPQPVAVPQSMPLLHPLQLPLSFRSHHFAPRARLRV
eukprot:1471834-Pleurochrysis_carterae.AAC.1